jgi:hypothetical protein
VRRHQARFSIVLPAILLLLALPQIGSAYVDPGSGAMLWQVAAASILGSLFYLRKIAAAIRRMFGMNPSPKTAESEAPPSTASGD